MSFPAPNPDARRILVVAEYGVLNGGERSFLAIVPPLIEYEEKFIPHLGLAAAEEILGLDVAGASMPSARRLRIPRKAGGAVELPLDDQRRWLIEGVYG